MSRHRVFGVVGSQVSQHLAIATVLQSPSLRISSAQPPLYVIYGKLTACYPKLLGSFQAEA